MSVFSFLSVWFKRFFTVFCVCPKTISNSTEGTKTILWFSCFSKGLCFIQGVLSQLQSRAQLTVDGNNLLASGFNVSVADGRLALQLSYSPPAPNRTEAPFSLDTALTAQFKGWTFMESHLSICSISPKSGVSVLH